MEEKDQHKITFTTPWGTFTYHRMPFGFINTRATFQRCMNKYLIDMKDRITIIYLDDITIFLNKRKNHIEDLRKVLQRCREHGISLNPKKSIFYVIEGKLLSHILSQEGIRIDPK